MNYCSKQDVTRCQPVLGSDTSATSVKLLAKACQGLPDLEIRMVGDKKCWCLLKPFQDLGSPAFILPRVSEDSGSLRPTELSQDKGATLKLAMRDEQSAA